MAPQHGVVGRLRPVAILLVLVACMLGGCQSTPTLATVDKVDLDRFMGDWYVIASVPIGPEKTSYNGVESYRRNPDGSIATTYTFREGGFDGKEKRYTPVAFVRNATTNAEWGMRFVWPFKAEYLITYLAPDYSATIISRSARDYAWIMARSPEMSDERYAELTAKLASQGYDLSKLRRVPQRW